MFVQRLVRLDRLSEVHVQAVVKLQLEVRDASVTNADVVAICLFLLSGCCQTVIRRRLVVHFLHDKKCVVALLDFSITHGNLHR